MDYFAFLFPVFFIGMWILVSYIVSKKGWADLAAKYKTMLPFSGTRLGLISAGINGVTYHRTLVLQHNHEGIYLRPVLLFRMFHPAVLIPWNDIRQIREKKILFIRLKELIIGEPFVAILSIPESTFKRIEKLLPARLLL